MRREAGEGGGLAAIERSELGHEGDESGGGLVAEAGDGDERLEGPGDRLALGGQGLDIGFDRRDLRIEAFDERIEIAACVLGAGGGGAIGVGEAIPDEVPSGQDEGLQAQAVAVAGLSFRQRQPARSDFL